ncbi:MAG: fatty acid desaturase [Planctomycetaceae bacterium]|nr:fatty acid desaturase [Planctomycetales bacterium]MCB9927538.1 fatty acid desaturase [Planctomycetaceae bacterium]
MRPAKELLIASREFAQENRWLSWWHLSWAIGLFVGMLAIAVSDLPIAVRGATSIVAGLIGVRLFIIYHDFQHGAILQDSPIATVLMWFYGMMLLNPPSVWNRSHNHHHKNNSKAFGVNIGSYPVMTTHDFASASIAKRIAYAMARHPLTILFGYFTVFLWRMSLQPFLLNPLRHIDGLLAVLLHGGVMMHLGRQGLDVLLFGMLVPSFVASALGAYLFYAQHNFPSAKLKRRAEWSHVEAALHSSSFMEMGPLMNWFTGNIGYHHVHHLNARIPFYRLPEAMAALEELRSPGKTSLRVHDIIACLRLKLWSPEEERFVSFKGI